MKTVIRIYDKSLMFRAENISCEFLEERLNIFCPNLTKEKMIELKIKNFKKNETDILKFSPADVTIINEGSSKVYTGDLVFDEEKVCLSLENYKIKKLINLGCFSFVTQINL